MEAFLAEGISDGREIHVEKRTICSDQLLYRDHRPNPGADCCCLQFALRSLYTAHIPEDIPDGTASYVADDVGYSAASQKE